MDVLVPLRHADGQVAERVRADVDAPGQQAVALLRGERPIVPDDVANRIGHRLLLSAAIVRHGMPRTGSGDRAPGEVADRGDFEPGAGTRLATLVAARQPPQRLVDLSFRAIGVGLSLDRLRLGASDAPASGGGSVVGLLIIALGVIAISVSLRAGRPLR